MGGRNSYPEDCLLATAVGLKRVDVAPLCNIIIEERVRKT